MNYMNSLFYYVCILRNRLLQILFNIQKIILKNEEKNSKYLDFFQIFSQIYYNLDYLRFSVT